MALLCLWGLEAPWVNSVIYPARSMATAAKIIVISFMSSGVDGDDTKFHWFSGTHVTGFPEIFIRLWIQGSGLKVKMPCPMVMA